MVNKKAAPDFCFYACQLPGICLKKIIICKTKINKMISQNVGATFDSLCICNNFEKSTNHPQGF